MYTREFAGCPETISGYPYASNSYVVNKAVVMAYAYDLCKDSKYIYGLTEAMDYLMGRNLLIKVYVSGYGENPVKYPHHRFFCPQKDSKYPSVPPGFFVSGPNSGAQNPWAGNGSPYKNASSQEFYLDVVESWDTNEAVISYNAPFAWVTYYIDGVGSQIPEQSTSTPTNTPVPEDVNHDGVINMIDVMLIAKAFDKYDVRCDLTCDGVINMADVMKLAIKFGYSYR
jgi:endoglucanase